jgi:hypothetical protein
VIGNSRAGCHVSSTVTATEIPFTWVKNCPTIRRGWTARRSSSSASPSIACDAQNRTPLDHFITSILRKIHLSEDDEVCNSPILVVETGFDRTEVDVVLEYLWQADRIECRRMTAADGSEMLTGIRRVLEGRERRWGDWGRYQSG